MLLCCFRIVFISYVIHDGYAIKGPESCISVGTSNKNLIKSQYCRVVDKAVELECPPNDLVVLSSLKLVVKTGTELCLKRILSRTGTFCCKEQDSDAWYDAECMQSVWTAEDTAHYQTFINLALQNCKNTSKCILSPQIFSNLPKEIPRSKRYSSYFKILYQCIKAPTNPIDLCSSQSIRTKEVHFLANEHSMSTSSKTCTCFVTSQNNGYVTVKTVDVRTARSELILTSDDKSTNFSQSQQALFGLKEIFTGHRVTISADTANGDSIWLLVSGSDGKDVIITCGETVPLIVHTTSTSPGRVATTQQKTVFWGYWPLIYIATGSIFTIAIVACILGSVLLCRKINKREEEHQHQQQSEHHHHQHLQHYAHHYATVLDDMPHFPHGYDSRVPNQTIDVYDMSHARTYQRPSVINKSTPQSSPLPNVSSNCHSSVAGTSCDVSELEAFLECKAVH